MIKENLFVQQAIDKQSNLIKLTADYVQSRKSNKWKYIDLLTFVFGQAFYENCAVLVENFRELFQYLEMKGRGNDLKQTRVKMRKTNA